MQSEYGELGHELADFEAAQTTIDAQEAAIREQRGGARLCRQVLADQLLRISLERARAEVAELRRAIDGCRKRIPGGAPEAPPFGARLVDLVAGLDQKWEVKTGRGKKELEGELSELVAENEELSRKRLELERKMATTAEDELKVLMLHAAAQDEGKRNKKKGEKENMGLRKQIRKTGESIARLRKRILQMEQPKGDVVELRLAALGNEFSVKRAMNFANATIEKLEVLVGMRREVWAEQRSEVK